MPELTLILPALNEARCIESSLNACLAFLSGREPDAEILVVDDGSTDGTAQIVERMISDRTAAPPWTGGRADEPGQRLRLLKLGRNLGKGCAVRAGLADASGRYVIFTDADLSTPVEELPRALAALRAGCEVALATRHAPGAHIPIPQPLSRRLAGRAYRTLSRLILRAKVSDLQCGMKGFTAPAARIVARRAKLNGYAFDAEIIILARQHGWRMQEVPIVWRHRENSKIRLLRDGPRMLLDLLRVRRAELRGEYDPLETQGGAS